MIKRLFLAGLVAACVCTVDITDSVKAGENDLEIRVVNVPVNRTIGDEFLLEDSERKKDGTLAQWPQWLEQGRPSPTGRLTFPNRRLWEKDDPPPPYSELFTKTIKWS